MPGWRCGGGVAGLACRGLACAGAGCAEWRCGASGAGLAVRLAGRSCPPAHRRGSQTDPHAATRSGLRGPYAVLHISTQGPSAPHLGATALCSVVGCNSPLLRSWVQQPSAPSLDATALCSAVGCNSPLLHDAEHGIGRRRHSPERPTRAQKNGLQGDVRNGIRGPARNGLRRDVRSGIPGRAGWAYELMTDGREPGRQPRWPEAATRAGGKRLSQTLLPGTPRI